MHLHNIKNNLKITTNTIKNQPKKLNFLNKGHTLKNRLILRTEPSGQGSPQDRYKHKSTTSKPNKLPSKQQLTSSNTQPDWTDHQTAPKIAKTHMGNYEPLNPCYNIELTPNYFPRLQMEKTNKQSFISETQTCHWIQAPKCIVVFHFLCFYFQQFSGMHFHLLYQKFQAQYFCFEMIFRFSLFKYSTHTRTKLLRPN